MDMGAYAQIETLEQIAKENGIEVPRLRGYRLMKNEEPVSKEEIENMFQSAAVNACEDLCTSEPFWNPNATCNSFCTETDRKRDYYLTKAKDEDGYEYHNGIRWDRIHGKKRKILKHEIKKAKRAIIKQYETFNKYAGREDVLYIHSRMGGGNWKYFDYAKKRELETQPWFLERVDDSFDSTYCDFYAKIKPAELEASWIGKKSLKR